MQFLKFLSLVMVVFGGCISCISSGIESKVEISGPTVQEVVTYQGPKARIAVASFKCKAAKCSGAIGEGLSDMLATALFRSGRFIVLERGEGLQALQEELNLGQSRYIRPSAAPQIGQMEGADILVIGAITAFEPEASGMGGGGIVVPFNVPLIGGAKIAKKEAYIAVDIRLIDVRTGRIINATSVEGKASSWNIAGGMGTVLGTIALGGVLGSYKNTPMEKAIRVMLYNAVDAIARMVPQDYYRWGGNTPGYSTVPTTSPFPAPQPVSSNYPPATPNSLAPTPGAASAAGLVRPSASFTPGSKLVWREDFSSCQEIPSSVKLLAGSAECVNFQGKKWLATVKARVDFAVNLPNFNWTDDWAIEYKSYSADYPWAEASVFLGKNNSPLGLIFRQKSENQREATVEWSKKPISVGVPFYGSIHHVALQKRGKVLRIFLNGRRVFSTNLNPLTMRHLPPIIYFRIGSGDSDIEAGKYTLITDITVTKF